MITAIRKYSIAMAVLLGLAACQKKLDLLPQTSITDASYWNTPNDLSLACNYLYTFLPALGSSDPTGNPWPLTDLYSDDAYGFSANSVSDGSRLAPASSSEWTGYYKLIRAANNILEKSVTVKGDAAAINKYLGEARFFRAFAYFELTRRFGDVLYINRTLNLGDSLLTAHRTPKSAVIDSIYADLDFATTSCPQPDVQTAAEYGRITATAALALKSRVGLFEGTWEKFHGGSNATKHLQIAIDASNAVIAGGRHALFTAAGDSSYFNEFQYQNNPTQVNYNYATNKENILVRLYGQNLANNVASHSYERGVLEQGAMVATKAFMDAYLFKDGLPKGKSAYDSSAMQTSPATEFRNRDPRIGQTIFATGTPFPSISGTYIWTGSTSYRIRKYFVFSDWAQQTSFVNFNVIRYAEVLLNNIEAKFELNGAVTDNDLNATINALRNRASNNNPSKLPLLSNAFVTANGMDMRTELRRERRIELAFEGHHYWDLLRWKTAETALPKTMLGPKYFSQFNSPTLPLTPDGFILLEDMSKRSFNPDRDYLWPLPTVELALNTNLAQNPNW